MRSGTSGLLPSRSVGPLPAISTTPGTFCSSLQSGSSNVPASLAPSLPANRTARCFMPAA